MNRASWVRGPVHRQSGTGPRRKRFRFPPQSFPPGCLEQGKSFPTRKAQHETHDIRSQKPVRGLSGTGPTRQRLCEVKRQSVGRPKLAQGEKGLVIPPHRSLLSGDELVKVTQLAKLNTKRMGAGDFSRPHV
eukprot:FR742821.1.p1 GENE.FR742821.1~~FR742821.1.p1  ORF type:complete len:132 (+),score=2.81 FR742821.1:64-459(+)